MKENRPQEPIINAIYTLRGGDDEFRGGVEVELDQQKKGTYVFCDGVKEYVVFMGDGRLTVESGTIRIPPGTQINRTISGKTNLEAAEA